MSEIIMSLGILILLIVDVIFNMRLMQLMNRDKDNNKIYVNCLDRWGDCVHHDNTSFSCLNHKLKIKGGECKSYVPRERKEDKAK